MKIIFSVLAVVLFIAGCDKDRFQTKPQIKIISSSTEIVPVSGNLQVVLEYTDKEGDVNDTLFITKQRMNQRAVPTLRDTLKFPIPEFPDRQLGQFELNLTYSNHLISAVTPPRIPGSNPSKNEADTLNLKFLVRDAEGNKSDSVILSNIIVIR